MFRYKCLSRQEFQIDEFKLVPIRIEDRFDIMKWRNEQLYHLRQSKVLTIEDQDLYFKNVVLKLFDEENPKQILFSYLENERCIGYGGLVHVNWVDKNAELSFIMNTELEELKFKLNWGIFARLIEEVAFKIISLHKIYTTAYDIRPLLYVVLEENGFSREAILKEHFLFEDKFINGVVHSKLNKK